jgi:hypothetical protein
MIDYKKKLTKKQDVKKIPPNWPPCSPAVLASGIDNTQAS